MNSEIAAAPLGFILSVFVISFATKDWEPIRKNSDGTLYVTHAGKLYCLTEVRAEK